MKKACMADGERSGRPQWLLGTPPPRGKTAATPRKNAFDCQRSGQFASQSDIHLANFGSGQQSPAPRNVRGEEEKMNGNETCVFAFGHLRNAHREPSHSARVFMDERARRILQDQNHDHALNEAILATEEERPLKTKLLATC